MIVKSQNKLYNMKDWRVIKPSDDFIVVSFFKTYGEGEDIESFEHVIEVVDEDYYYGLSYKNEEFDHKDIRQIKYRACDKAYAILIEEIKKSTEFIDLDVLINQEQLCKEAVADYLKEFEDDNVECESNS